MPTKNAKPADPPSVADATEEAQEASALVAAIEERIRDGDVNVSASDLTSAKELAEFARLQQEAATRRARQAAIDAANAEVEAACKAAFDLEQYGLTELEALRVAATDAFAAYCDAAGRSAFAAIRIGDQIEIANLKAEEYGLEQAGNAGVRKTMGALQVREHSIRADRPKPLDLIFEVVGDAGFEMSDYTRSDLHSRDGIGNKRPWPPQKN